MTRVFLGTLTGMVWVILVLAAVSWLVVTLISEQERGESLSIPSRLSAGSLMLRKALPRLRSFASSSSRKALERVRSSRRSATLSFRVERATNRQVAAGRPVRGDGWRSRLVALVELILFVVLISALFAGAMAAAALRIGRLGA
jgi:hypothetical protein